MPEVGKRTNVLGAQPLCWVAPGAGKHLGDGHRPSCLKAQEDQDVDATLQSWGCFRAVSATVIFRWPCICDVSTGWQVRDNMSFIPPYRATCFVECGRILETASQTKVFTSVITSQLCDFRYQWGPLCSAVPLWEWTQAELFATAGPLVLQPPGWAWGLPRNTPSWSLWTRSGKMGLQHWRDLFNFIYRMLMIFRPIGGLSEHLLAILQVEQHSLVTKVHHECCMSLAQKDPGTKRFESPMRAISAVRRSKISRNPCQRQWVCDEADYWYRSYLELEEAYCSVKAALDAYACHGYHGCHGSGSPRLQVQVEGRESWSESHKEVETYKTKVEIISKELETALKTGGFLLIPWIPSYSQKENEKRNTLWILMIPYCILM